MCSPYKEPKGITAFLLRHFIASLIALMVLLVVAAASFGYLLNLLISSGHA